MSPKQYKNTHLYEINYISGELRYKIGRKPTASIIEDEENPGEWIIELRDGIGDEANLLGYYYQGQTDKPASFPSKQEAVKAVLWSQEFLDVRFPQDPVKMTRHALQIISDDRGKFRWVILVPSPDSKAFENHSTSDSDFESYGSALNAGTIALSQADAMPYENEAADPVGKVDGGNF